MAAETHSAPLSPGESDAAAKEWPLYTRKQVESEASAERVLTILHNSVYDLTSFVDLHPGGGSVLMAYVGRDATGAFDCIGHSQQAHEWREKYKVGEVVDGEKL